MTEVVAAGVFYSVILRNMLLCVHFIVTKPIFTKQIRGWMGTQLWGRNDRRLPKHKVIFPGSADKLVLYSDVATLVYHRYEGIDQPQANNGR
jgi:hypothetical protein